MHLELIKPVHSKIFCNANSLNSAIALPAVRLDYWDFLGSSTLKYLLVIRSQEVSSCFWCCYCGVAEDQLWTHIRWKLERAYKSSVKSLGSHIACVQILVW